MREELDPSNALNNSKKDSKSRRRLHEAEVLSTTPCTAPVRKPQQDSSNIRSSLRGLTLDDHNQQLPSQNSISSSVGGTIDEYNRISNKTGGFEGALPLQYDAIFPNDDNTVHFDSTVKSSPELGQKPDRQNMNGRDAAFTRRRLFQKRRSPSMDDQAVSPKIGFFRRWTSSVTANKDQNLSSSSFGTLPRGKEKHQTNPTEIRPPKLKLSSRGTTSVTIADSSDKSVSKSISNLATTSRTGLPMGSPRFMLPDETPPGSKSTSRKNRGSDNTSAAVVARHSQGSQISDDQGFELSISSAPPTYSTPRKQHQRSTVPVDLDEVDGHSSSEESSIQPKRVPEKDLFIQKRQNHSATRPSSLSPMRKRISKPFNTKKTKSQSAHSRLGVSFDSEDDISKFSAEHLGAIAFSESLRRRQSSSESDRTKGYSGLKRWILPAKRTSRISTPDLVEGETTMQNEATPNTLNGPSLNSSQIKIERQYQAGLDEVQSLSPDQRESIFANMELVEKERSASEHKRRSKSTVKSTSYTQSTTSSSKDAPVVRLPMCVVCNFHDRTHIAVPCMHFAFCRECSMRLAKLGKGCVVCNNQQVTFAAVSV
jgi:Zinc finger, C3HC4 type (RING finger)